MDYEVRDGRLVLFQGEVSVDVVALLKRVVDKTETDKDDVVFAVVEPLLRQVDFKPEKKEALKQAVEHKPAE